MIFEKRRHAFLLNILQYCTADRIFFAAILLLGVFLRFKGLTFQSMWYDELCSVVRSAPGQSFSDIMAVLQSDPQPPLFYTLLHYWMILFGNTEFSARLLVAITGSLSLFSVYYLARVCINKKVALIALFLTSINFFNIFFSQEVRPYIFLFLFTALSYASFIKLLREQNVKHSIIYGVVTAIMLYTHYYGLIYLLSQSIFLAYYFFIEKNHSKIDLIKFFGLSGIVMTIIYSPWIPRTLAIMSKSSHWNPKPKPDFFLDLFQQFFGSNPFLIMFFSGLLLVLLFHFLTQTRREVESPSPVEGDDESKKFLIVFPLLFGWVFFSLFIPYFRSIVKVPMYYPNYAIGILPAIIVMIALSIHLFKSSMFKAILLTGIFLVSMTNLFVEKNYYGTKTKEDWRGVARYVIEQSESRYGETEIFYVSLSPEFYEFYFKSFGVKASALPQGVDALGSLIDSEPGKYRFIWVLKGHGRMPDKKVFSYIKEHYKRVVRQSFGPGEAFLFEFKQE